MRDRLTVYACWDRARKEFPEDPERRKYRFVELMRAQGHIVPKDHPEAGEKNLPCGWPGPVSTIDNQEEG